GRPRRRFAEGFALLQRRASVLRPRGGDHRRGPFGGDRPPRPLPPPRAGDGDPPTRTASPPPQILDSAPHPKPHHPPPGETNLPNHRHGDRPFHDPHSQPGHGRRVGTGE